VTADVFPTLIEVADHVVVAGTYHLKMTEVLMTVHRNQMVEVVYQN
jgi:hypothetical protein